MKKHIEVHYRIDSTGYGDMVVKLEGGLVSVIQEGENTYLDLVDLDEFICVLNDIKKEAKNED